MKINISKSTLGWSLLLYPLAFYTLGAFHGLVFALCMLGVSIAQEAAHLWVCKKHQTPYVFPYLVPVPNAFGTLGTLPALRTSAPSGQFLWEHAFLGLMARFGVALILFLVGLFFSKTQTVPSGEFFMFYKMPLIGNMLLKLFPFLKHETGQAILFHPMALAGGISLFLTFIHALPIGQLEGGNLLYVLIGPKTQWVSWGAYAWIFVLGFVHPVWFIIAAVLLLFFVRPHFDLEKNETFRPVAAQIYTWIAIAILCFCLIPYDYRLVP